MRPRLELDGAALLVTGAGRGIGAELARRAARAGAHVALLDRDPALLAETAGEIGPAARPFTVDVTEGEALDLAVDEAARRLGKLDVVVANAGITAFAPAERIDPATFERVIAVNLTGAWRTLRAAIPHVRETRGYLLTIASLAAAMQSPLQGHYTASKAGIAAATNSLRVELRPDGVDVGVAYPIFVATEMMRRTTADAAGRLLWHGNRSGVWRQLGVDDAVDALLAGIRRRSSRIVAPRSAWPLVLAPGVLQPVFERLFRPASVRRAAEAASPSGWTAGAR